MMSLFNALLAFSLFSVGLCISCTNPTVTSKSFTTQDATIVTKIAYISEFTLKCGTGAVSGLYAELDGNILPVSTIAPNVYQISWTEDIKNARGGDREVHIYDEDGYTALKKAIRAGEAISSVPQLFNVIVNHPGAYNGPWFKSEFIATAVSFIVAYIALASRSKITC